MLYKFTLTLTLTLKLSYFLYKQVAEIDQKRNKWCYSCCEIVQNKCCWQEMNEAKQRRTTAYSNDVVFTKAKLVVVMSLKVKQRLCAPSPVTRDVDVIVQISCMAFHWVVCLNILHGANKNKMVLNLCLHSVDCPLFCKIPPSELNNFHTALFWQTQSINLCSQTLDYT